MTAPGPAPAHGPAAAPVPVPGPGPEDALTLPITAVTCLEDRAQVERTGTVQLTAGVQRLRVGPVTPLAVDRSLRAEVTAAGARVVDARVVRGYAPAPPGEPGRDASQLRRDVHELERELYDARQLRQRQENALAVIDQARADLHRDIVQGAGAGSADPERWSDRLDRVDQEAETRIGELHRLLRRVHDIGEELREAAAALAATENEPPVLTAYVELVVESDGAGPARLRVAHLVPCALWRPAYRATLAADGGSVRLETDAFVWQRTGEDWSGAELSLSTARPTLAASPPALTEDVLALRERSAEERRTVEVNLREEEIRTVGGESPGAQQDGAAGAQGPVRLPGLDDGGAVRTLKAPRPVDVPCDGRPHRVHLSAFTAGCRAERSCSPELSALVVTTARFANESGHVLLAGPVDLVRGSGFVGRGELAFAGAGEQVRLAFGSEDTFRVVRHVEESRDTAGLTAINQRTVITREVRLFVSRLDAPDVPDVPDAPDVPDVPDAPDVPDVPDVPDAPDTPGAPDAPDGGGEQELVVRERVPVSEVSAVEVRLRAGSCSPEPDEVDAEGIVRYVLRLGPGERREIVLGYDLTASSAVTGL